MEASTSKEGEMQMNVAAPARHAARVSELANTRTKEPSTKEGKCFAKTELRHNTVTSNPDIVGQSEVVWSALFLNNRR